jgi:hypothetical protein
VNCTSLNHKNWTDIYGCSQKAFEDMIEHDCKIFYRFAPSQNFLSEPSMEKNESQSLFTVGFVVMLE